MKKNIFLYYNLSFLKTTVILLHIINFEKKYI